MMDSKKEAKERNIGQEEMEKERAQERTWKN